MNGLDDCLYIEGGVTGLEGAFFLVIGISSAKQMDISSFFPKNWTILDFHHLKRNELPR